MKKHFLFVFATLLPLLASAEKVEINGIWYNLFSATKMAEVTYKGDSPNSYNNEYSGSITIPAIITYDGVEYSVVLIGVQTFRDCSSLTAITIPEGVMEIGSYAFYNCKSLTSITIPEGVTSIGNYAFFGCSKLTSITIPESITSIGKCAFSDCSRLTSITIPEGVTRIGDETFSGCSSLTSATIPKSMTWIGSEVFYNCSKLTSITIPEGVTSIGDYAFYNCSSLIAITIPESVTKIGDSAFSKCNNLEHITINCSNVGNWFSGMTSIKEVVLGKGVTSIGDYAFSGCYSIERITINCANVGSCFSGMTSIKEIVLGEGATEIGSADFSGCSNIERITINCANVGSWVSGITSIKEVVFGKGVTEIEDAVFSSCSNLIAVHISDIEAWCDIYFGGVNANPLCIAENLYLNGELITTLAIPNKVTEIKDYAFYNCRNLTSITIPKNMVSIGNSTFYNCKSLKTVINYSDLNIQKGNDNYGYVGYYANRIINADEIIDGYVFKTINGIHYLNGYIGNDTELALPDNYQGENYQIGARAFSKCSNLTSITIPESVTSIGDYAFSGCSNLTSITIPEGVTNLGIGTFSGCQNLISINISKSVTSIGEKAFFGCSNLSEVHIDNIEAWCNIDFGGVDANPLYHAKNLYLNGELITSLVIPNTVTAIKNHAFYNCHSLADLTIPESITSIGESAFYNCTSLKIVLNYSDLDLQKGNHNYGCIGYYADRVINTDEIIDGYAFKTIDGAHYLNGYVGNDTELTLPENYQGENYQIGADAFYNCSSLTSITIPESVTSIGDEAFYDCCSLVSIYISDIKAWCNIDFSGYYANPLYFAENLYLNGELATELTIPNIVTSIKNYTFCGCSSLISINLPDNATSIGDFAFYYCSNLTSITIPENVTFIGNWAFKECCNLKIVINYSDLDLQKGNHNNGHVGYYADRVINTDEIIDGYAFKTIDGAHYLNGYVGNDTGLTLPENYQGESYQIGDQAFFWCASLTSITIPESVTSIGDYAFYGCSNLQCIIFPEKSQLTSIGNDAFYYCSGLTSITLPESLTEIGDYAFYGCNSLTLITCHAVTPPTIGDSNTFYGVNRFIPVYVPEGSLEAYKAAEYWSEFSNIIGLETGIDNPEFKNHNSETIHDLHGRRVEPTTKAGIYIVNGKKIVIK